VSDPVTAVSVVIPAATVTIPAATVDIPAAGNRDEDTLSEAPSWCTTEEWRDHRAKVAADKDAIWQAQYDEFLHKESSGYKPHEFLGPRFSDGPNVPTHMPKWAGTERSHKTRETIVPAVPLSATVFEKIEDSEDEGMVEDEVMDWEVIDEPNSPPGTPRRWKDTPVPDTDSSPEGGHKEESLCDGQTFDFPCVTWEEDESFNPPTSVGKEEGGMAAILHSSTRLEGDEEGVIPDTGAVKDIAGSGYVERQDAAARRHGMAVEYEDLAYPEGVAGVGGQDRVCTQRAKIPCPLSDGTMIKYCPVVTPQSDVPPLMGNDTMSELNVYFGTRQGTFTMIPEGSDDKIIWPPGTKHIQCVKAPSRHWLLTVSAWQQGMGRNTQS